MLRSIILFLFALFLFEQLNAQKNKGSLKGKVVDSISHKPIQQATISVVNLIDTTLTSFTFSDKQGNFEMQNLGTGTYAAMISHQGMETIIKSFSVDDKRFNADIGMVNMSKQYTSLNEVIVKNIVPIIVNGDTVQFNSNAFKTKPNATAEDLLKKLPGVQVDKEGNVLAQGEDVQKVLVDGKEFFGKDPKMATRNLTADMIESVQVFDDMSEQAKFSRIDDGSRSKTINLKLKKDKKKGNFGRALLSAGTADRYEGNFTMNRFDGDKQISLLANVNNINKTGYSLSGTKGSLFSSGNDNRDASGIARAISTGLNFSNDWASKLKANGSYSFSNINRLDQQEIYRQSFFPADSTALLTQKSNTRNMNQNHRFNLLFEFTIDSMNSIMYIPRFNVQRSENFTNDSSSIVASRPGLEYLSLTNRNINTEILDGTDLSQNLLYRRKFRKAGRTFTLGWNNAMGNKKDLGYSISPFSLYKQDGSLDQFTDQNQQSRRHIKSNNNLVSASLTEAIGRNKLIEVNYAYTYNQSTSERQTMNYNSNTKKYDISNLALTNDFENKYSANRIGANFRVQQDKFNFQLGGGVQFSSLNSHSFRALTGKDSLTHQRYTNIFPTANFRYSPEKNKNLGFTYRGRSNQPSIIQLQDVQDLSNPLQVYTGNPFLDQEFSHSVALNYTTFNKSNFKYASYNLSMQTTDNKIVNSIDSLNRGVQMIMPVNQDGAYNFSSLATFGFPFKNKKLQGSNLNFTTSLAYNRNISLLYKQLNIGKTISASQSAGANFNFNEIIDLSLNANLAYNRVSYSVNTYLNDDYLTQTFSADVTCFLPMNFILSTDIDYYINSGRTDGFNQSFPFWNGYIAKQLFENSQAEIRFSVNDILNQNKKIGRFAAENYIEDSRSNVLQRFFMISFMYNLSKLALGNYAPPPPPM